MREKLFDFELLHGGCVYIQLHIEGGIKVARDHNSYYYALYRGYKTHPTETEGGLVGPFSTALEAAVTGAAACDAVIPTL